MAPKNIKTVYMDMNFYNIINKYKFNNIIFAELFLVAFVRQKILMR